MLRYGGFYGPGTSLGPDGGEHGRDDPQAQVPDRRRRRRGVVVHPHRGRGRRPRWRRSSTARAASTTSSTTSPRRWRSGCRTLATRRRRQPPRHVPRWLGRMLAGEAAAVMMTEVRGASNAKAKRELGWQPRHPSWRQGFAEAAGVTDSHEELLEELRPTAFAIAYRMLGSVAEAEDVVQEALLRLHRALEAGRADRVAAGVPGDRRHAARASTSCARPACAGRPTWASGSRSRSSTDSGGRSGAPGRDGRLALARLPRAAGEPLARAAGGVPPARRVRLRLRPRSPRSSARARTNARQLAARARRHVDERQAALRGLARAARRARASASSRPPRRATSAALEALLAHDVVLHGDGGGKVPALARALHGPPRAWRGRCAPGCGRAPRIAERRSRQRRGERPARRVAASTGGAA